MAKEAKKDLPPAVASGSGSTRLTVVRSIRKVPAARQPTHLEELSYGEDQIPLFDEAE